MNTQKRSSLLIALLIGTGVAVAGCDRPASDTTNPNTTNKKTSERATDNKVATQSGTATTPATSADTTSKTERAGAAVDDTAITTKVKAAILAEPGLHSMDIGVDTNNAVVTLTGTVDSPPLKDRAKKVASSVSGVRSVVDNLTAKAG
jgi:hyperosmotically inducible periplasmic protein